MFDPRNIWFAMAIAIAAYLVYRTSLPTPQQAPASVAYLRTPTATGTTVTKITRDECLASPKRLWGTAENEVACLAYVTPESQPQGGTALVYFHGDFSAKSRTVAGMAASLRGYQRRAARIAERYSIPVYIIARPGVMGSTGFHVIGGIAKEHRLIATAIGDLKRRYGIERLALAGQSGGARIAAQLLVSGRDDIACAAMASGAYDIPQTVRGGRMPTNFWGEPSRSYLIPLRNIDRITRSSERKLYVIGDTRDQRAGFDEQRAWADALKRAGHHAELLQAAGSGKEFHGLTDAALDIAARCATGASDEAIAAAVREQRSRRPLIPNP